MQNPLPARVTTHHNSKVSPLFPYTQLVEQMSEFPINLELMACEEFMPRSTTIAATTVAETVGF